MSSLTASIAALGPWIWLVIAVVLLALETVIPGVHFLWFGLAAAVTGIAMLAAGALGFGAGFGWPFQVILFALLSFLSVFVVRRWARPDKNVSDLPDLNARAAQYVGRTFVVAERIDNGRGKIKVGDSLWAAEGPDLPEGSHVRVTGARSTVLVVEPA